EYPMPENLSFIPVGDDGEIPDLIQLGLQEFSIGNEKYLTMEGGEKPALARLQYYIWNTESILTYKQTRNNLMGDTYSSKLSPYLSLGCISPRRIYHEIIRFENEKYANDSTYWLIFELLWRDFFRFMFKKHGNRYFLQSGIRKSTPVQFEGEAKRFESWKNATTPNQLINAFMKELKATGYLSNRGRQIVASYLIHDLKVNWTWGAWYFEEYLIDYSPASNWGNWSYLAGVGNDPKEIRIFNPEIQALKFDPHNNYSDYWNNLM
nr:DASH family cryptochrome [Bacteroidia bacterium]